MKETVFIAGKNAGPPRNLRVRTKFLVSQGSRAKNFPMSVHDAGFQATPHERALVLSIRLFRIVGGVFLLFFLIEGLSSLADLQLRNPASELRFAAQITDRIPLCLLGLVLLLCHPRFLRKKPEALAVRVLASLPFLLAGGYLFLIPLTMFSAANYFRSASYGLEQQVEEQAKKVRGVRDATLNLSPEQQQNMVDRYNSANPKKQPVDLEGFLKTLNEEVKASEAKLEQERRNVMGMQRRSLYGAQFVQLLKVLAGSAAFFFVGRAAAWAQPRGQAQFKFELGLSSGRQRHG